MSEEEKPKAPWYAKYLSEPNLYLVVGCLLVLASFGAIKIGDWVAFNPSEDIPNVARYVIALLGFLLVLSGMAIRLRQVDFFSRRFAIAYFSISFFTILIFGIVVVVIVVIDPREVLGFPDIRPRKWHAYTESFVATVEVNQSTIARYRNKRELLLICRKADKARQMSSDTKIEISNPYDIAETMQDLELKFSRALSASLVANQDVVECVCVVLPKGTSRDKIRTLSDISQLDGRTYARFGDHVRKQN